MDKSKKTKSILTGGALLALLVPVIWGSTYVALKNGDERETQKILDAIKTKQEVIDALNKQKDQIDKLLATLDPIRNKEQIDKLNGLKNVLESALEQSGDMSLEELVLIKNNVEKGYNDVLNFKKNQDQQLLNKYDDVNNKLEELLNKVKDNPQYGDITNKLNELKKQLQDAKDTYSKEDLLTLDQVAKIESQLKDAEQNLNSLAYDKVITDLNIAIANKNELVGSLGSPVADKYVDFANKYEEIYKELEDKFANKPDRDSVTKDQIAQLENVLNNLNNNVALEKLDKVHADLNEALKNNIDNNLIAPLTPEQQDAWDQLFKNAQELSNYNNPELQNTQDIENAIKKYEDQANAMLDDLTSAKNNQDTEKQDLIEEIKNKVNEAEEVINNLLNDPKYENIKNELQNVINKANNTINKDFETLTKEELQNKIDELAQAIEKAKEDKNKFDQAENAQAKANLDKLAEEIKNYIDTNLNVPGLNEVKNTLETSAQANKSEENDTTDELKKKLDELNKAFEQAKKDKEVYDSSKEALEKTLEEINNFKDSLPENALANGLKDKVTSMITKAQEALANGDKNTLDKVKEALDKELIEAKQDKEAVDKLITLEEKIKEVQTLIDENKLGDTGLQPNVNELENAKNEAQDSLNELKDLWEAITSANVESRITKLQNALDKFNKEKTDRELAKEKLTQAIDKVNEYVNNNLQGEDYKSVKEQLENAVSSATNTLTDGTKAEIEQAITNLENKLSDAEYQKGLIDQANQNEEAAKNTIDQLIGDIQNWIKENLNKPNSDELAKESYQTFKDTLTSAITKAQEARNVEHASLEDLKKAFNDINNTYQGVKTQYANHKVEANKLDVKLAELQNYVDNNFKNKYADLNTKYQDIINQTNASKNTWNTEELRTATTKITNAIIDAQREKATRDKARNGLLDQIKLLDEFIPTIQAHNLTNQFITDLENFSADSKFVLAQSASDQALIDQSEAVKEKLAQSKQNKQVFDALIQLDNAILDAISTHEANVPFDLGLKSAITALLNVKDQALNNHNIWSTNLDINNLGSIAVETNKVNKAIEDFKATKTAREESKTKLLEAITTATQYANETLGDNANYASIKAELEQAIQKAQNVTTEGDKTAIDKEIEVLNAKLGEIQTKKTAIDQNNANIDEARTNLGNLIEKVTTWKDSNLTKDGQNEILTFITEALKNAKTSKETNPTTVEALNTALETLKKAESDAVMQHYDYNIASNDVDMKSKQLQNYINDNFVGESYKDLKDKYEAVINEIKTSQDQHNTEALKKDSQKLIAELEKAKHDKTTRDNNVSELKAKITEAQQYVNSLQDHALTQADKEKLNNLIGEANSLLTNGATDEQIKAKSKEIADTLNEARAKKSLVDNLIDLDKVIQKGKGIYSNSVANDDIGLSEVQNTLNNSLNQSETNYTTWSKLDENSKPTVETIKAEIAKVNEAISTFEKDKAARDLVWTQLWEVIDKASEYSRVDLSGYGELQQELVKAIFDATNVSSQGNKNQIEQAIKDLNAKLNEIVAKKAAIDQQNQSEAEAKAEIEKLTNQIEEWITTNLNNGTTSLSKPSYSEFKTALETAINEAQRVKDDKNSHLQEYKDAYNALNNKFSDVKTNFANHTFAYNNLQTNIGNLDTFVKSELNDPLLADVKAKYEAKVSEINGKKDTLNEAELKEASNQLIQDLSDAQKEKATRDANVTALKSKIQEAKNYVAALPDHTLTQADKAKINQLVSEAETLITNVVTDAELTAKVQAITEALNASKAQKDKVNALIELDKKLTETLNKYNESKSKDDAGLASVQETLKQAYDSAKSNYDAWSADITKADLNTIKAETTKLTQANTQFDTDKALRENAKTQLQTSITQASEYSSILTSPDYTTIKSELEQAITTATATKTSGDKTQIEAAKATLDQKLAQIKGQKEAIDQNNASKAQVKDNIQKLVTQMNEYKLTTLTNDGQKAIKDIIDNATSGATQVKDNPTSTLDALNTAYSELQSKFTEAKNAQSEYEKASTSVDNAISALETYVKDNLSANVLYTDFKDKYNQIVTEAKNSKASKNTEELKALAEKLANDLVQAKADKTGRDEIVTKIQTKAQEIETFNTTLVDHRVNTALKSKLTSDVADARNYVTTAVDNDALNNKLTELNRALLQAKSEKFILDTLINLDTKLQDAKQAEKVYSRPYGGLTNYNDVARPLNNKIQETDLQLDNWINNHQGLTRKTINDKITELDSVLTQYNADVVPFVTAYNDLKTENEYVGKLANGTSEYGSDLDFSAPVYREIRDLLNDKNSHAMPININGNTQAMVAETAALKAAVEQAKTMKSAIDQQNTEYSALIDRLEAKKKELENWQNTNLKTGSNLSKPGYKYINDQVETEKTALQAMINKAKDLLVNTVPSERTIKPANLKEKLNQSDTLLGNLKTELEAHKQQWSAYDAKIKELDTFVKNDLNDTMYQTLKTKYANIVTQAKNAIDNKTKDELITAISEMTNTIAQAKAEKDKLDRDTAAKKLKDLISTANTYINNTNADGLSYKIPWTLNFNGRIQENFSDLDSDWYKDLRTKMSAFVTFANRNIDQQTTDQLKNNFETLNKGLEQIKVKQKERALEAWNTVYTRAVTNDLNLYTNNEFNAERVPGVNDHYFTLTNGGLLTEFDKYVNNNLGGKQIANQTDATNVALNVQQINNYTKDFLAKTQETYNSALSWYDAVFEWDTVNTELKNSKAELEKLDAAKYATVINEATQRLNNYTQNSRKLDDLETLTEEIKDRQTVGKIFEAFKTEYDAINTKAKALNDKTSPYNAALDPQYTAFKTAYDKLRNTDVYVTDVATIGAGIRDLDAKMKALETSWTNFESTLNSYNANIATLEQYIKEMKNAPDGTKYYKRWIDEAEGKLAGWKNVSTLNSYKTAITQMSSYNPALKGVKDSIANAYTPYIEAKKNAEKISESLLSDANASAKFVNEVMNVAKNSENIFFGVTGTNSYRGNDLVNATTAYNKALDTYKAITTTYTTEINKIINNEFKANVALANAFKNQTISDIPEHLQVPYDSTALHWRDDLVNQYLNFNPSSELKALNDQVTAGQTPLILYYSQLKNKLERLKPNISSDIKRIKDDNWIRNQASWTYKLRRKELLDLFNANLTNNAMTGVVDQKVLEFSRNENAWKHELMPNANDVSYHSWTNQIEGYINEYKTVVNAASQKESQSDAASQQVINSQISTKFISTQKALNEFKHGSYVKSYIGTDGMWNAAREFGSSTGGMNTAWVLYSVLDSTYRNQQKNYSQFEAFLREELLTSMFNLTEYWSAFGASSADTPMTTNEIRYNILKNFVKKFYTDGHTAIPQNRRWNYSAKERYANNFEVNATRSNYDFKIRTWETSDFNNNQGILDLARKNYWHISDQAKWERTLNIMYIWYRDGLFNVFTKVWEDITKVYSYYINARNKYESGGARTADEWINVKVEIANFIKTLYDNGYKQTDSFGQKIDLFHPGMLNILAEFVKRNNL